MPDIVLRLRIDDKEYDAKIIEADQQLKKLYGSTQKVTDETGKMATIGKRDIGIFASQILYSADVTGRLGSQLSNVAQGLLTGGAIGAAFAGFAAIINVINTRNETQIKLINELTGSLDTARSRITELITEYKKLTEPSFVDSIYMASLMALGLGASEIAERIEMVKKLQKTFKELEQEEGTVKWRLENQIKLNEELRDQATTAEEYTKYQKIINELQAQFNLLSGETKETVNEIIKVEEKLVEEKVRGAFEAYRVVQRTNAAILEDTIATNQKIAASDKDTKAQQAGMSEERNRNEIDNSASTFSTLQGQFAQHTAVFKAASAAQTLISTYQGAQNAIAALSTIPVVGPSLGLAMATLITGAGLARAASILSTEIPGYAQGGIVVGEKGPEVIAPMDSYAEGQSLLVAKTIAAVQNRLGGEGGNIEKKLDQVILAFNRKQFRIKYDDLYTANDKSVNIINELEF